MDAHDRNPSDPDSAAQPSKDDSPEGADEQLNDETLEDAGLAAPEVEPSDGPAPAP